MPGRSYSGSEYRRGGLLRTALLASTALAIACVPGVSHAQQEMVWNGTTSDFNDITNWTNNPNFSGSFTTVDNAPVLLGGVGSPTIVVTAPIAIQRFVFGSWLGSLAGDQAYNVSGAQIDFQGGSIQGLAPANITFENQLVNIGGMYIADTTNMVLTAAGNTAQILNVSAPSNIEIRGGSLTFQNMGFPISPGGPVVGGVGYVNGTVSVTDGGSLTFGMALAEGLFQDGVNSLRLGTGGLGGSLAGRFNTALIANFTDSVTLSATFLLSDQANGGFQGRFGRLQKDGSGTLTLTGANEYSGGTILNGGKLVIGHNDALGFGGLTTADGTTVGYLDGVTVATPISLGDGTTKFEVLTGASATQSGVISGSSLAAIEKTGDGTLSLTGVNTYGGGTTVSAGTLIVSAGALGATTAPLTVNGGTLNLNAASHTTGALTLGGGTIANGTLTSSAFNVQSGSISAVLAGGGALTKTGSGTVTLSGTNTYSGGTNLNGGILSVTGNANLGNTAGALNFNGGTLKVTGGAGSTFRTINWGANGGGFEIDSSIFSVFGSLSGTGGLTKSGGGGLFLAGSNTYSGTTTVTAGDLTAGSAGAFSPFSAFTVNAGASLSMFSNNETIGSLAGAGNVLLGAVTLTTGGDNTNTTFSGIISNFSPGSLTKTGTGTMTLSGANTYTGGTTLDAGVLSVGAEANLGGTAGALTFNGGTLRVTGTSFTSTARTINWGANGGAFDIADAGNTFTVNQTLTGNGGLTKLGAGTLTLAMTNAYAGGTTITAGTLAVATAGPTLGTGTVTLNGGTFRTDVSTTLINGFALNTAGGSFDTNGNNPQLSGVIADGDGVGVLNKIGAGALVLSGTNTYTGATMINAGTLALSGSQASIAASAGVNLVNAGTSFSIANRTSPSTIKTLTGVAGSTVDLGLRTLILSAASTSYAGTITGNGGLTMTGGTQTLTGTSNYTGATNINGGGLVVNGSIAASSSLNINSGGFVGGTGTLPTTTVGNGGTLSPGNSIGTLQVQGT